MTKSSLADWMWVVTCPLWLPLAVLILAIVTAASFVGLTVGRMRSKGGRHG